MTSRETRSTSCEFAIAEKLTDGGRWHASPALIRSRESLVYGWCLAVFVARVLDQQKIKVQLKHGKQPE